MNQYENNLVARAITTNNHIYVKSAAEWRDKIWILLVSPRRQATVGAYGSAGDLLQSWPLWADGQGAPRHSVSYGRCFDFSPNSTCCADVGRVERADYPARRIAMSRIDDFRKQALGHKQQPSGDELRALTSAPAVPLTYIGNWPEHQREAAERLEQKAIASGFPSIAQMVREFNERAGLVTYSTYSALDYGGASGALRTLAGFREGK